MPDAELAPTCNPRSSATRASCPAGPVFRGKRVPVDVPFAKLAGGLTVNDVLESYTGPTKPG
jgi:hypothetical protein